MGIDEFKIERGTIKVEERDGKFKEKRQVRNSRKNCQNLRIQERKNIRKDYVR